MNDAAPVFDFAPWAVESLRLTILHPLAPTTSGLWQKVMGVSPEQIDSRPRQSVLTEQGDAHGNQLRLVTQSERLDWHVVASPVSSVEPGIPPYVTSLEQAITVLGEALDVSLREVHQVDRLAFAPVISQQASSLDEATSKLSVCLPQMDLVQRGGSDFMYQINRRRRSLFAPHVVINCLAKWQVEQFQSGALRISPSRGAQLESSDWGFMVKLLLDINTAPDNNAISNDRMPGLFAELTKLAHKIASEGDVL